MPATKIPFGEWLPDQAPLGNPGLLVADNVLPHRDAYRPMPSWSQFTTTAMDSRCLGAASFQDKNGDSFTYGGDATKLYRLNGTAWTDASKVGGYSLNTESTWRFTEFGERAIAATIDEPTRS